MKTIHKGDMPFKKNRHEDWITTSKSPRAFGLELLDVDNQTDTYLT